MVTVRAPGSCGELVQGTLCGENFLVTCPINLYSEVAVIPNNRPNSNPQYSKVCKAIEQTVRYLNLDHSYFDFEIKTQLPIGKGMASSSADISAACQAVGVSLGVTFTPDEIADIALAIEPTDAIFYPGIFMFDHVNGRIRNYLGTPPDINIAVFDIGGEINTMHFNKRSDLNRLNAVKEEQVINALNLVKRGLANGDIDLIGQAATISARANQIILYKPNLEGIINISRKFGAAGVNVAHSGTVIGILFDSKKSEQINLCIKAIREKYSTLTYLKTVKLVSGGLQIKE